MPTLNVNGDVLHYVDTGGGSPTLVLVHGAGGSHETWTRQLEGLADAARVVAIDLPGHSASPGEGRRTVTEYADVVRAFVASLGTGPVVLGGHSMGGAITQTVALGAPELLRGVVLVGTGARLRVFPKLFELLATDHDAGVDFVTGHGWSPSASPELRETGRRAMRATPLAVTTGDFRACDAFDVMNGIAKVALPTLVVVGADDRLTPPKYAQFLAAAIAGARLVNISRAGHFVPLEQPDAVNDAIREFLAAIP